MIICGVIGVGLYLSVVWWYKIVFKEKEIYYYWITEHDFSKSENERPWQKNIIMFLNIDKQ
jgi:hypothetical protein